MSLSMLMPTLQSCSEVLNCESPSEYSCSTCASFEDALLEETDHQQHHDVGNLPHASPREYAAEFELVKEVLRHELESERTMLIRSGYLALHQSGTSCDITPYMRLATTSWMVEVAVDLQLSQTTLFLSITYLDSFLSAAPVKFNKKLLQLLAVAGLCIACKHEERQRDHVSTSVWVEIAAQSFTREDLRRMELLVLQTLGWRCRLPTSHTFLELLPSCLGHVHPTVQSAAAYLIELSSLDYTMLEFRPSLIALTSLCIAHLLVSVPLPTTVSPLLAFMGSSCAELQEVAKRIIGIHHSSVYASQVPHLEPCKIVQEKFMASEWHCVGGLQPLPYLPHFIL